MPLAFWLWWLLGLAVSTAIGAYVVKHHRQYGLMVLGSFLAIYVVGANILVPRLCTLNFFGLSLVLVTGSIIWPFGAQVADMVNEIYGKKAAYVAAAVAYLANAMFVGFALMGAQASPIWAAEQEAWWQSYFGVAGRVLLASTCSFISANYVDIQIFSRIKARRAEKESNLLGLLLYSGERSVLSDGANMVVDNLVFYTIAFIGTMPGPVLLGLIGSSMLAKVILSQIDLPFYWLFRVWTRGVRREF